MFTWTCAMDAMRRARSSNLRLPLLPLGRLVRTEESPARAQQKPEVEVVEIRGRDRQGGTKNRLLASQKTNSAGKGGEMEKSAGAGRKTRRRGTGGASPARKAEGNGNGNGEREREREGRNGMRFLGGGGTGEGRGGEGRRATSGAGPTCQDRNFPEGPGI
ncbi:hypothetical protein BDA96_10G354200 [Sorghum bicolor]|uniref:Uncharacterized protein n=1 Tax=Sorghum bicolor TaxID=4558 RepID=A0A921Q6S7_SORBI|nr:hypothetical protein BDA96_10G354200 [Sorghum bicolor]